MSEDETVWLTQFRHGAGCRCKLDPSELAHVVGALNTSDNPNVLVGLDTGDDAGIWDLGDGRALISTVDFITPLVNDARMYI